jgi:lipoate-protein ligase A
MARDQALAEALTPGEGVFRVYSWDPPTVSFGKNEPARGLYDEEAAARRGVEFVRRPTGGRAVLHDKELTYSLVLPVGAIGGLKETYRTVNIGLLRGLESLGASAALAEALGPSLPPDSGPCFQLPAEGEVTALGRKLIGSAQARIGGCILQHGSLILDGDQDLVGMLRGDTEPVSPPATLRSLLGTVPDWDALALALESGLAHTLGGTWSHGTLGEGELDAARRLEARYLDPEWTWRL